MLPSGPAPSSPRRGVPVTEGRRLASGARPVSTVTAAEVALPSTSPDLRAVTVTASRLPSADAGTVKRAWVAPGIATPSADQEYAYEAGSELHVPVDALTGVPTRAPPEKVTGFV